MPTVLFLCTGNYYRSRFAEIYFNWLADQQNSEWRADSRGLALDPMNLGPLSVHTREALKTLQIALPEALRLPTDLSVADLEAADHVVAVKQAEHAPLVARRFPEWSSRIEFWHVHDLDCATSAEALPQLKGLVTRLFERLNAASETGG